MTNNELARITSKLYFKWRDNYYEEHGLEDWEQAFFNEMERKCDTATEHVSINLFYWDDDTKTEMVESLLNELQNEKMVAHAVVEDADNSTTVAVMLLKNKQGA